MPGYRRFIAYVYEYSQGKKGEGKGFIKVEARNGNCRMNFKLEGAREGDGSKARVYGYVREEEFWGETRRSLNWKPGKAIWETAVTALAIWADC